MGSDSDRHTEIEGSVAPVVLGRNINIAWFGAEVVCDNFSNKGPMTLYALVKGVLL